MKFTHKRVFIVNVHRKWEEVVKSMEDNDWELFQVIREGAEGFWTFWKKEAK